MRSLSRPTQGLGYAGLLPALACLVVVAVRDPDWSAHAAFWGLSYAGIILSFLGGIWWGFAMRRERGQGALALLAVMPSLAAVFIVVGLITALDAGWRFERCYLWASVALAISLVATLAVDRQLEAAGEAPSGWTRFRATLSLGLGTLTLLIGVVIAMTVQTVTYI